MKFLQAFANIAIVSTLALTAVIALAVPGVRADLLITTNGYGVFRFDQDSGQFLEVFIPPGSGGLHYALGMAYGADGNLYVACIDTVGVLRYDGTTGDFIDAFVSPGSGGLIHPFALTFGPDGNLYVVDQFNNSVVRYDGTTGDYIDTFVYSGSGGLDVPRVLAFGPDGNLYVASANTQSVKRYNGTTGDYIDDFVSQGSGGLPYASGLLFGPDGNLYVGTDSIAVSIASMGPPASLSMSSLLRALAGSIMPPAWRSARTATCTSTLMRIMCCASMGRPATSSMNSCIRGQYARTRRPLPGRHRGPDLPLFPTQRIRLRPCSLN
jgi:streptogramin lyase